MSKIRFIDFESEDEYVPHQKFQAPKKPARFDDDKPRYQKPEKKRKPNFRPQESKDYQ